MTLKGGKVVGYGEGTFCKGKLIDGMRLKFGEEVSDQTMYDGGWHRSLDTFKSKCVDHKKP